MQLELLKWFPLLLHAALFTLCFQLSLLQLLVGHYKEETDSLLSIILTFTFLLSIV